VKNLREAICLFIGVLSDTGGRTQGRSLNAESPPPDGFAEAFPAGEAAAKRLADA
jgi:hypothetical protein